MKDEFKEIPINKFIGLKSKMYCIASENGEQVNTAKGVDISIEFGEYENVLFNKMKKRKKKLVQMISAKYLYHVLMTKDTF